MFYRQFMAGWQEGTAAYKSSGLGLLELPTAAEETQWSWWREPFCLAKGDPARSWEEWAAQAARPWCSQGTEVALHCQREILNCYMALNSKPTSGSPEQWVWIALWSFEHWCHDKFPENSCKIFLARCILSREHRNGFVKWWIGCFMNSVCPVYR